MRIRSRIDAARNWIAAIFLGLMPVCGVPAATIYVGNIPLAATAEELNSLFSEYGQVTRAEIVKDPATGQSRGFALVEMADEEAAQTAIEAMDKKEWGGRIISVNNQRRADRPRTGRSGEPVEPPARPAVAPPVPEEEPSQDAATEDEEEESEDPAEDAEPSGQSDESAPPDEADPSEEADQSEEVDEFEEVDESEESDESDE